MNKYNREDLKSIYNHAVKLKDKSFKEVLNDYFNTEIMKIREESQTYGNILRKGGLGELIEKYYFNYEPDNESRPDFPEAELELKVTPFKVNKNETVSAKERLVISMINYFDITDSEFYESSLWKKLKNILLIYYEWNQETEDILDFIIKYIYLFSPSDNDLNIIIQDYLKIRSFIKEGRAHELSESLTMYLGAVTKAADSTKMVKQPYSDIPAKPRAFSLKTSFMTQLLRDKIIPDSQKLDQILKDDKINNFEEYVLNKIAKFKGYKDQNLFDIFLGDKNPKDKNKYSRLAYSILGVKTNNAEEFLKANIQVKAVRIEENGHIRESMSFPIFNSLELVNEEWENSDLYKLFSETKFLFIIYKKSGYNYYLDNALFWNMPNYDLDNIVKNEWQSIVDTIKNGVKFTIKETKKGVIVENNLPKKSETKVIHVRNHSSKSAYLINGIKYGNGKIGRDTDELPDGNHISKQCFWLNNDYIKKIITK